MTDNLGTAVLADEVANDDNLVAAVVVDAVPDADSKHRACCAKCESSIVPSSRC